MQSKNQIQPKTAWYREPMVLMIVAIPATAIVVGFTLLALAINSYDGLVVDDYYKVGKEINQTLDRKEFAERNGISVTTRFENGLVVAELGSTSSLTVPARLQLRLIHPTRAGRDQIADMRIQPDGSYRSELKLPSKGNWLIVIETSEWRLQKPVVIGDIPSLVTTLG